MEVKDSKFFLWNCLANMTRQVHIFSRLEAIAIRPVRAKSIVQERADLFQPRR
jgi:hypothetical protein